MKKILFLLLGISSLANAQTFLKIYGDTSHEQNSIHLQTPQGYYLVNHERNPLPYGETEIIRTNLSGDSLQSWFLPEEFAGLFNAIAPISGNRFVSCVSNYNLSASIDSIIITWYDSSFQIISSVIITDTTVINI